MRQSNLSGRIFHAVIGKKWCAGPTVEHVMQAVREDHTHGRGALVNYLGEHCKTADEVRANIAAYELLIDRLAQTQDELSTVFGISIKPTQFGLDVAGIENPAKYTAGNMQHVVTLSAEHGIPVWMDMEDRTTTIFTLDLYKKLLEMHGPLVRVILQANLKRTPDDLRDLMFRDSATVRLVKGIYHEHPSIAFMTNAEIHRAFSELIRIAFTESPPTFGIAIGSHHSGRIREAVDFQNGEFRKDYFVVQMLRGVMKKLGDELVKSGVPLETYQPYGPNEFPYSVRRMRESPSFILGLLRAALFERRYARLYEHIAQIDTIIEA